MKRASVSERTLVEYLEPFRCKFYEHEASGLLWRKSHCRGTLRSATSQPDHHNPKGPVAQLPTGDFFTDIGKFYDARSTG